MNMDIEIWVWGGGLLTLKGARIEPVNRFWWSAAHSKVEIELVSEKKSWIKNIVSKYIFRPSENVDMTDFLQNSKDFGTQEFLSLPADPGFPCLKPHIFKPF